jgi:acetyl esterase/lipase
MHSQFSLVPLLFALTAAASGADSRLINLNSSPSAQPIRYLEQVFRQVRVHEGIVYGSARNFGSQEDIDLALDLYEPEGDERDRRPAIVWIHGGGFTGGTRQVDAMVTLAQDYASRGYVCVSISYRLRSVASPEAVFDAAHDAKAAVRWLRAQAETWRIDPDCIIIGGGSAGAITACNVAYLKDLGEGTSGNPGLRSDVQAVVDFWGGLLGPYDSDMSSGDAPLIIFHGTLDTIVAFSEAEELTAQASMAGVPHAFFPLEGIGHAAWGERELFDREIPPFLYEQAIKASPQHRRSVRIQVGDGLQD